MPRELCTAYTLWHFYFIKKLNTQINKFISNLPCHSYSLFLFYVKFFFLSSLLCYRATELSRKNKLNPGQCTRPLFLHQSIHCIFVFNESKFPRICMNKSNRGRSDTGRGEEKDVLVFVLLISVMAKWKPVLFYAGWGERQTAFHDILLVFWPHGGGTHSVLLQWEASTLLQRGHRSCKCGCVGRGSRWGIFTINLVSEFNTYSSDAEVSILFSFPF